MDSHQSFDACKIYINHARRWLNDADGTRPWNAHAACLKKDIKHVPLTMPSPENLKGFLSLFYLKVSLVIQISKYSLCHLKGATLSPMLNSCVPQGMVILVKGLWLPGG